MFGICWGSFNSLTIASSAPEPLKTVLAVCSWDDRYDNDVHYLGGIHTWAATMLTPRAAPAKRAGLHHNERGREPGKRHHGVPTVLGQADPAHGGVARPVSTGLAPAPPPST
jgi:predicted acyl esterase